jgi:23S rRNA A2030 N6-methylase RlmJ
MYSAIIKKDKKGLENATKLIQFPKGDAEEATDIMGSEEKNDKSNILELELKLQSAKKKK